MWMEKGMTPIDRELSKKVVKIIHSLLMMEESAAFRKPVPHKALGLEDYKLIVKKPTDLNLIRRQYNDGKYKFVEEVLDEIQLCWDNCKLYNAIGSDIYNQALFMEAAFDKNGIQVLPDFWIGVNRQEYNQKFNEKKIEENRKKPQLKPSLQKSEHLASTKEDLRNRYKKKVTFQSKNSQSEENVHQEVVEHVSDEKQKEENVQNEQIQSHQPSLPHIEKASMEIEEGEQNQEMQVEPILVSLKQNPTKQQLLLLTEQVKNLYQKEELTILQKILEILHANQKENMKINKHNQMSFEMNKIHISTYYRIKKILGMPQQEITLIE